MMTMFLLSVASILTPLLVSAAPVAQLKQPVAKVPGSMFTGSLTWYPQQPELVLATISNNSTTNYAILAKNNLFDDVYTYDPLQVKSLSGEAVDLVGTRHNYPELADSQFKAFPVGAVWERYLKMSDYIPPSPELITNTSQCFNFALPASIDALNVDVAKPEQRLADLFFLQGLAQVPVESNPLHMNVTVSPGTPPAAFTAQEIPTQPAGLILPPSEQNGSISSLLATTAQEPGPIPSTSFQIASPGGDRVSLDA
ncbi:MAG: hypothetical protein LQ348_003654 [Seirophora lacunosa]|nr:MAG: hypothetical protein LQ344_005915 [Seirophora lacunosa]KAI4190454.1 MAG: hypothetical protein LQ348_003654 [Seirophora lacunosa]